MIYGIVSDIHGNLEALSAVLEDLCNRPCDQIFCLGDIVGYGADPGECLRLIREICTPLPSGDVPVVQGNHEEAVVTGYVDDMNEYAAIAALWTKEHLASDDIASLSTLPKTLALGDALLAHSSPYQPEQWRYVYDFRGASKAFYRFPSGVRVCFIGHTHAPCTVCDDRHGHFSDVRASTIHFEREKKYLVNVGSVGQPRDSDPRASYSIYDSEMRVVELRRVEYDISTAQRKIREAGLPERLALRLELGK